MVRAEQACISGKEVDQAPDDGWHQLQFSELGLASGTYLMKLRNPSWM